MIPSLSLTTKPGNYTKFALGNNQNKLSSEVISLSQVRNTETKIWTENSKSCFLFSRNNIRILKLSSKRPGHSGERKRYAEGSSQKSVSNKHQD